MKFEKTAKILAFLMLSVFVASSLFSCGENVGGGANIEPKSKYFYNMESEDFLYFNTECVLSDYSGSSDADFSALCAEVEERLSYYHKLFDIYNEYEGIVNIATINKNAGGEAITVDPILCELLSFSLDMYEKTDGYVNVAMGSVLSLWHDAREAAKQKPPVYYIPDIESLESADEHTDPEKVIVDTEKSTVQITDSELRIDVGAVAKGFAAEKISEYIKSRGLSGYVINFGRNIRLVGTKPNGSGWESGVAAPGGRYANVKNISDSSFVTSGIYERNHEVDGKMYHHIINPKTLMPDERYWSVSIHTESSATADALSTAFFNMSVEQIENAIESFPETEVTVIYPNGEVLIIGSK